MSKYAVGDDPEYNAGLNLYSSEEYRRSAEYYIAYFRKRVRKGTTGVKTFQYWEVWNNLGNSFAKAGEFKKAETCYINAIKCLKNTKLIKGIGIVAFNYACMLFFEKMSAKDIFKAYVLFMLSLKCGFKSRLSKKVIEQFILNARIMYETSDYFYKSRLCKALKENAYIRRFIRISVSD